MLVAFPKGHAPVVERHAFRIVRQPYRKDPRDQHQVVGPARQDKRGGLLGVCIRQVELKPSRCSVNLERSTLFLSSQHQLYIENIRGGGIPLSI